MQPGGLQEGDDRDDAETRNRGEFRHLVPYRVSDISQHVCGTVGPKIVDAGLRMPSRLPARLASALTHRKPLTPGTSRVAHSRSEHLTGALVSPRSWRVR